MKYQYKMSIEQGNIYTDPDGLAKNTSLQYDIESNDDAFSIIEGLRSNAIFDDNVCAAFVFGLKSLGFAMISNRDSALVEKLMPHFTSLMKEMKKELSHTKSTS